MKTTSTDRMRRTRRRRRFGMQFVTVEIPLEAIELLEQQGYLETRTPASIGLAITALLSDFSPGRDLVAGALDLLGSASAAPSGAKWATIS